MRCHSVCFWKSFMFHVLWRENWKPNELLLKADFDVWLEIHLLRWLSRKRWNLSIVPCLFKINSLLRLEEALELYPHVFAAFLLWWLFCRQTSSEHGNLSPVNKDPGSNPKVLTISFQISLSFSLWHVYRHCAFGLN